MVEQIPLFQMFEHMKNYEVLMKKISTWLRPTTQENPKESLVWLEDFLNAIEQNQQNCGLPKPKVYKPCIQALKDLIKGNAELPMQYNSMFDQIPCEHRIDSIGNDYVVRFSLHSSHFCS